MITENNPILSSLDSKEAVDFIEIAKILWKNRILLIFVIGICTIIGVLIAFLSPKEYTVTAVIVPQISNSSKSQLGGLAALAGLDISMSQSTDLSPVIYPKIVNSVPFKLELMNTKFHFDKVKKPVTIYEYFTLFYKPTFSDNLKKYTIGLPSLLIDLFRNKPKDNVIKVGTKSKAIKLTKKQNLIKKYLDNVVTLNVEKKEGYLTLSVKMQEPLLTAEVAEKALDILQRDIIKFKVQKSQADLDFIAERYNVAKAEAEGFQINIAVNNDRYKNLTSNVPQVSNARIQTKYSIVNSVYQDLAKQLEQAKIQVKRDTPIFTIIEPVTIPTDHTKPHKLSIIFIWIVIGIILGIGSIYSRIFYLEIKNKWNIETKILK